jgi:hypothetical protein
MKRLVALSAGLFVLGGSLGLAIASRGSDNPSPCVASPQARSNPGPRFLPIVETGPPGTMGPQYFGFIPKVDASRHTIQFDQARWLSGEAAQRAAEEDGVLGPGEPVSNDYYIRNRDQSTRTLKLWPGVSIVGAETTIAFRTSDPPRCDRCYGWRLEPDEFFAAWQGSGSGRHGAYWITLWKGRVAVIQEQYRP